jgi:hypothetical protein
MTYIAHTARSFIEREGGNKWDKNRQRIVWDAIALHGIINIAQYKDIEVALVAASSFVDLLGLDAAKATFGDLITLTQGEREQIFEEFPSTGEKKFIFDQLVDMCRTKPDTTYDNYVGDWGEKYLENYTRVGHRAIDMMERLLPE